MRERFSRAMPVHVTLRVVAPIASLRRPDGYHAIRQAIYPTAERDDFRIVHLSIDDNHLHLIVEADHHIALSRGSGRSRARQHNGSIARSPGPPGTGSPERSSMIAITRA
jgi:REP element-mobilizing transposase RayT